MSSIKGKKSNHLLCRAIPSESQEFLEGVSLGKIPFQKLAKSPMESATINISPEIKIRILLA
jgi:hypothetical protein